MQLYCEFSEEVSSQTGVRDRGGDAVKSRRGGKTARAFGLIPRTPHLAKGVG